MDFKKRFYVIVAILAVYVCFIGYKSYQTVITDGAKYRAKVERLKVDSVSIPQLRGFIFADGNELLAGSLPEYDVFLDFKSTTVPDSKGKMNIPPDTIAYYFSDNGPGALALHRLNPRLSAAEHARLVRNAYQQRKGRFQILHAIPYLEYKKMRAEAPFFNKRKNLNGLLSEERAHRYRPYGETRMASSTIGSVFAKVDATGLSGRGKGGIEEAMDSILRGVPGLGFRQRIRNRNTDITVTKPVNGANVHTTINIEMQNILDQALHQRIIELRAHGGWAAILECKTGQIKAISNLERISDSETAEDHNHLFEDLVDPGSTFKTVSYMVLLDNDKITPETIVSTGDGFNYHGQHIRDDHSVGTVTADEAMVQSSNISLAKLTTGAYEKDPQRYLDLIDKTRIFEDMHLEQEFDLANRPRNRKYKDANWSKMSLAQISYGYETRIPGMYILNFYNAIANDGKLMRPYIVDRVVKDGKVLYRREPEVINSRICKPETLKKVRHALEGVVEHGTARTEWNSQGTIIKEGAQSRKLKIAGKTGTAQRYANGGYSSQNGHYVSFAGYFPADDPQYTCVVVMDVRPGGNFGRPGGGYMAGPVFRNFAEQVYARSCRRSLKDIKPDSANIAMQGHYPKAKRGPERLTSDVASGLGLSRHYDKIDPRNVNLNAVTQGVVPSVMDMGAVDALYMLESVGLRVTISGKGKVYSQSIPAGSQCKKGQAITISLR